MRSHQVGPVIDAGANARIRQYIDEAESRDGATVLLDGRNWTGPDGCKVKYCMLCIVSRAVPPHPHQTSLQGGNWVGPTILLHKSSADAAMQQEIFGPVLSVIRVNTWQEAITIENANPYGKTFSFSDRIPLIDAFLMRMCSGWYPTHLVALTHLLSHPDARTIRKCRLHIHRAWRRG